MAAAALPCPTARRGAPSAADPSAAGSPSSCSSTSRRYLPISPHISPYLPISPHISPYLPVLVLVTQQTASAAEIFAAALAHAGNALVLGTHTFGKGTSQAFVHLPGGHGLTFTVYSLAAGAASASHPLNDGVAPHVRWQWWSAVSTATAAADREIALAADAALRATSCSAAA